MGIKSLVNITTGSTERVVLSTADTTITSMSFFNDMAHVCRNNSRAERLDSQMALAERYKAHKESIPNALVLLAELDALEGA